jgi:hypothetical protein
MSFQQADVMDEDSKWITCRVTMAVTNVTFLAGLSS